MSDEILTTSVNILDKDYRINCPSAEEPALIEAARNLDKRMRDIRNSGKVIGVERIAVMAALNITHELLQSHRTSQESDNATQEQISSLLERLEGALKENHELEL